MMNWHPEILPYKTGLQKMISHTADVCSSLQFLAGTERESRFESLSSTSQTSRKFESVLQLGVIFCLRLHING